MEPAVPSQTSPWMDRSPDQRRFTPLSGGYSAEIVVIGGGVAGIMTAWHLSRQGLAVVLVEKNHLVTGDTSLTTGFLTRVPDTSFALLRKNYGTEFVRRVFAATTAAQNRLFELITGENIACEFLRCDSYYSAYDDTDEIIVAEWAALEGSGVAAELFRPNARSGAFNAPLRLAIKFAGEGRCNMRRLLLGLVEKAVSEHGLKVFEESEVVGVEIGNQVRVQTAGGTISAKKIIITTGLPLEYFSETHALVEQQVSYVAAARYKNKPPLTTDLFWDTFEPYFYYRLIDEHTLILGGCDRSATTPPNEPPLGRLRQFLNTRLAGEYEISNFWSGSLFHTNDGLPYAFRHPYYGGKVFIGCGFGGNGLVFGCLVAETLAALALGRPAEAGDIVALERTGASIAKPAPRGLVAGAGKKEWVIAGSVAELKNGRPVAKNIEGTRVVLFQVEGNYYALHNACSHAGGMLSDGTLEGRVIQCPLHGAKFNVTTGAVIGPPAIRPQKTYPVKIENQQVHIEIEVGGQGKGVDTPTQNFRGAERIKNLKNFARFCLAAALFGLAQFLYQYYLLIPGELNGSLVRSFAVSGATLIGAAVFLSSVFKWFPKTARYWRIRRYFGVTGFAFIFLHVASVLYFLFQWDIAAIFYSFNPFKNPIIFGVVAYPVLFVMAVTSTDWAVNTLTPKVWKNIHRFIYLAYPASIFHFVSINPALLKNVPGYLLLVFSLAAIGGQLFWFVKTIFRRKRFLAWNVAVGLVIIAVTVYIGYRLEIVTIFTSIFN